MRVLPSGATGKFAIDNPNPPGECRTKLKFRFFATKSKSIDQTNKLFSQEDAVREERGE